MATPQEVNRFENSKNWRRTSAMMRNHNPVCQRIDPATGEQCNRASEMVHHILAPETHWELRQDFSNLVAVCKPHHPNTTGDNHRQNYTPTREVNILLGTEVFHAHAQHAEKVIVATGAVGKQGTTTAVGSAAIDKALAGIDTLNLDEF
jgi:hypothetical protein